MVEHNLAMVVMRVRFPSPAPYGVLAQSVELSAVNRSVVGSSPTVGAIQFGLLEKRLNSHAFHACIHGFESRIGHHLKLYSLLVNRASFFVLFS